MSSGFAVGIVLVAATVIAVSAQTPPPARHTIDQTERLAKAALAAELKVPVEAITVRNRGERHWPDAELGCALRKGVFEPVPTPGYIFTLRHDGTDYELRADRYGHVRRCPPPRPAGKAVSPPPAKRPPGA